LGFFCQQAASEGLPGLGRCDECDRRVTGSQIGADFPTDPGEDKIP
jgi:hypothetical protein